MIKTPTHRSTIALTTVVIRMMKTPTHRYTIA